MVLLEVEENIIGFALGVVDAKQNLEMYLDLIDILEGNLTGDNIDATVNSLIGLTWQLGKEVNHTVLLNRPPIMVGIHLVVHLNEEGIEV